MSLIYFVFLEMPLSWRAICPMSLPPPRGEKAFVRFTTRAAGTRRPDEMRRLSIRDTWVESRAGACAASRRRSPGWCPAVVSTTQGSRNQGTVPCGFGTWISISLGYFGKRKLEVGDETIRKTSTSLTNISNFQDSGQCCSEVVSELRLS